jgi:nitroreductase
MVRFLVARDTVGECHGGCAALAPQLGRIDRVAGDRFVRRSQRDFAAGPLPADVLGMLLWAACGVNRAGMGGRTAPSPLGVHEIDIYVALAQGVYRYAADTHTLELHRPIDIRGLAGLRDTPSAAPLDLIYVADLSRMKPIPPRRRPTFAAVTTGAIAQNVYLYCASMGLATTVHGWLNQEVLAGVMRLGLDELPVLAQTVGYPANAAANVTPSRSV